MSFGVTAVFLPEDNDTQKVEVEDTRFIFLKHECAKELEATLSTNEDGESQYHDGYGFAYCDNPVPGKLALASFRFGAPNIEKCSFLYELADFAKLTIFNEQGSPVAGIPMWAIPPSVSKDNLDAAMIEDMGEPMLVKSADDILRFFNGS